MAVFSNARAMAMATQLMQCKNMEDVICLLRAVADTLPVTKRGASQKKKKAGAKRRVPTGPIRGWKEEMNRLADSLERNEVCFCIFAAKGNMKLPFCCFSSLPFVTCPGMGKCGEFCYSKKAWRTPGGFLRQFQNTALLLFHRRPIIDAFKAIKQGIEVRLYVDGDFGDMSTLIFWMNMLAQRPDLKVYGYSKSWELLLQFADSGRKFPDNYVLNLSSGSRYDGMSEVSGRMMELAVTRNWFLAVDVDKRFMRKEKGYSRWGDPEYHRAVRAAAAKMGYLKVLSCSGSCSDCVTVNGENQHACGAKDDNGKLVYPGVVAIGAHG